MLCILCTIFVFVQIDGVNMIADETAAELTYSEVNKKIVEACANSVAPSEIFKSLTEEEVQILYDYYVDVPAVTVFSEEIQNSDEVAYIDALANQYYDELERRGEIENIPEMSQQEIDELFDSIEVSMVPNASRAAICYEPENPCAILQILGYTYTILQVSKQLVTLGVTIGFSAAFPFLELAALIVGAVIITMSVAILYCAAATAANDLIFGWYYNSKTKVKEANETTALVVAQHQSGAQFWEAFRRDWFGLGGIIITRPILLDTAKSYIKNNQITDTFPDVFCVKKTDAFELINEMKYAVPTENNSSKKRFSGIASPSEAHRDKNKIFNMQHVHAMYIEGGHGHTHIFYAIPFEI